MDHSFWLFLHSQRHCFPLYLIRLAQHTAADAGTTVSEVPKGLLRWLSGDIPRGGAEIALAFCLCVFWLHQSGGRRGCSGGLPCAHVQVRLFFLHTPRCETWDGAWVAAPSPQQKPSTTSQNVTAPNHSPSISVHDIPGPPPRHRPHIFTFPSMEMQAMFHDMFARHVLCISPDF